MPSKDNLHAISSILLQALMAFIGDCPDVAMLEDVLIAVLDLLRHTPPGRIPLLAGMSGAQLFVSLLSREQPALRILGLHLLAHFVPYIQSGALPGIPPNSVALRQISGLRQVQRLAYNIAINFRLCSWRRHEGLMLQRDSAGVHDCAEQVTVMQCYV